VTVRLRWADVCARRLARHHLATPLAGAPADAIPDAVSAMCGAHAQIMSAAELSIGVRVSGVTGTDVRHALWSDKSLVKTYGPRGTVHLLPARDLPMWTGALSAIPVPPSSLPATSRLTNDQHAAVLSALGDALSGPERTIDELDAEVVAATGPWAADAVVPMFGGWAPRWRTAMTAAAHAGLLCQGPARGRTTTYTTPRAWIPGFRPEASGTAIAILVERYMAAYGPATPDEFARWLGAPRAWVAAVFASMGDRLYRVAIAEADTATAYAIAGDESGTAASDQVPPGGLRLLSYFDAYSVGCHPRSLVFPGRATERALTHGQAGTFPVVLVDGVVRGIWHHRRSGRRVTITVEPFARLRAVDRRELDEQVDRVGVTLGAAMTMTFGEVAVAAHK
jgi:hypothetical protein